MTPNEIEKIITSGKNVYVVGIKGAGVSALAQILKAEGFNVVGSDTHERFFTDELLKKAGIPYSEGFDAKNIPVDVSWAFASNAYLGEPIKNPEVLELRARKIPVLSYPDVLSYFFNKSRGVAIAGTHGKTSTTAMVAYVLQKAGLKPKAVVGGELLDLKTNALSGTGDIFVLEADEYKDAFLNYHPELIAILNTDWDHPDYFKTEVSYKESFEKFRKNLKPGGTILEQKDFTISSQIKTPLIGDHNQGNLAACYAICRALGVKDIDIREALKEFTGTRRRLEVVEKFKGNIVMDDYAHNSQKVAAALKALKSHYVADRKIIVVFQPHTYSRTAQFLNDFADSLLIADEIYLLDIYASAREAKGTITSDDIIKLIEKSDPATAGPRQGGAKRGRTAKNLKTVDEAVKFFCDNPPTNSVIVFMGAGDVGDGAHKLAQK